MATLQGVLELHSETGTEGGRWAFQDAAHISLEPASAVFGHGEAVYDPATGRLGRAIKAQRPDGSRAASIEPGAVIYVEVEWTDHTTDTRLMSDLLTECWSHDGLHVLKNGNQLTIYDPGDITQVLWSGTIQLQPYEPFTQHAYGFWIRTDQLGVDRQTWARWFLDHYPAQLTDD